MLLQVMPHCLPGMATRDSVDSACWAPAPLSLHPSGHPLPAVPLLSGPGPQLGRRGSGSSAVASRGSSSHSLVGACGRSCLEQGTEMAGRAKGWPCLDVPLQGGQSLSPRVVCGLGCCFKGISTQGTSDVGSSPGKTGRVSCNPVVLFIHT